MNVDPEIEKYMKELAQNDWDEFLRITGLDPINLVICHQKAEGKSWQQISNKTGLSKGAVRNRAKACRICVKK